MCTLIVLHRCYAEAPVLVAANRDEYLDRPAESPTRRRSGSRTLVAPRDLRAGGTWLGTNDAGVFAALTNRPTARPDATRRSRGLLVEDALAAGRAHEAAAAAARLPADAYNPFNLFVCDEAEAFAIVYEDKPVVRELAAGVHVVGNADPDCRRAPKTARLLGEAERVAARPVAEVLDALADVCRVHGVGASPLEDTCIHAGGYGTRSSTLLRRGGPPGSEVLRFAEGPPCANAYRDLTTLLGELDPRAGVFREAPERTDD